MGRYILVFLISAAAAWGQDHARLADLQTALRNFDYQKVIDLSDRLLNQRDFTDPDSLARLYELKARSHYALGDALGSTSAFLQLLQIDPKAELDPLRTSPKIIDFFQQLKQSLAATHVDTAATITRVDTVREICRSNKINQAAMRSILVPGWGHVHLGEKSKGFVLAGTAIASMLSTLMLEQQVREHETAYLNETDPARIEERYQRFKDSSRNRTLLFASTLAIWLYSQIDLLYFTDMPDQPETTWSLIPGTAPRLCLQLHL